MAARVVVNGVAMAEFVNTNPVMQKALAQGAEKIMGQAIINSPHGQSIKWGPIKRRGQVVYSHHHGYFKEHFYVRRFRNYFQVWNNDPYAHLIEWGSVKNSAYAPIRRAVRSSGLRYKPNPDSRGA